LQEEKKADQTLTKIAESAVNRMAACNRQAMDPWRECLDRARGDWKGEKWSFGSWGPTWIPLTRRLGLRRLATDELTIKRIRCGEGLSYISRERDRLLSLTPSPIHDTNSRLRPGDADMETSPATDGAFYPDAPIVGLDDTLADRQPQSRASPRRMIAPPKTVEDVRQVLGRDPWAGVPNDNLSMALALACAKRHATPLGREENRLP
jgi:hypothetical protein